MQIILLSGGSGKRLWPLSNEVRSKQFLRLLQHGAELESMVQRVYRQIRAVDALASVTVATSRTQVSAIQNQLGDKVSICVEPCRRDTFPAIVLAAAFLRDEKGVPEDEVVAVCPVDPYVDNTYYETVGALEAVVRQDLAPLTLMGIEPSYPSEKYGYIIPETAEKYSAVWAFKEKPDLPAAQRYIEQGALWNAGVFAFRLGYLLQKAHELIPFTDYRDLFARYGSLPKTSFDYAVVEKEPRIAVVRYAGGWKDVGTWNTMAEVVARPAMGNAVLDETCVNTHVVNELDIPVLVMGAKDLIVAASSDGILVADKERSSAMKPYVEKMAESVRYAEKSWGTYTVIDVQPNGMTIRVVLRAGSRMKYHSHEHRDEVWTVVSGTGRTLVDGMEQLIHPGDVVTIAAGCRHTVEAQTDLTLIEVQIGKEISAQDKTVWPCEA